MTIATVNACIHIAILQCISEGQWERTVKAANFIVSAHMSTNTDTLVKISPVLSDIFAGICRFFKSSKKLQFILP